jgi:hypothetical protein
MESLHRICRNLGMTLEQLLKDKRDAILRIAAKRGAYNGASVRVRCSRRSRGGQRY